jgi:menaquinone-dependent protoporphyrinogen IX oxidase
MGKRRDNFKRDLRRAKEIRKGIPAENSEVLSPYEKWVNQNQRAFFAIGKQANKEHRQERRRAVVKKVLKKDT